MKRISLVAGGVVAAFVLAISSVQAAAPIFVNDLTIGSSNPEVHTLQTLLIAQGFDISAITSGAAQKGYFGAQTKAAVQKYQRANGVPSTGFVGPLTRAKLNGASPVANPGMITTPGIGGTLAFSLEGSPAGASLDKGETEDVARFKLQAAASDMQVSSLAIDFDTRFWLYASSVTIKDGNGAVITSKNNLSVNDFTELTVGSDYRLYIPVSYVVPRTQTRYLTVSVSMLPVTDRDSATITINDAQIRSVDGTGVTDTQTVADDRTFSYTASNSSQVVITLNDQSPPNMLVPISRSTDTEDVVLAVANFKSQNQDSMMRTISFYVTTNGITPSTLFRNVKIKAGDLVYTSGTVANGNSDSLTTITDMRIPLLKDQNTPVYILATINKDSSGSLSGSKASTTLIASGTTNGTSNNPVVENATYNTVDINDMNAASSEFTFSTSDANLFSAAPKAVLGAPVQSNNTTVAYPVSFTFSLSAGNDAIYVSADPVTALATTSSGYSSTASDRTMITTVTANPSEMPGDSTGSYFVISPGTSRTFTWSGVVRNQTATGVALRTFKIEGIRYGTSVDNIAASTVVYYDYDALKVTPVI